jgi:hypothetical protein
MAESPREIDVFQGDKRCISNLSADTGGAAGMAGSACPT